MCAADLLQERAHYYLTKDQQTVPKLNGRYVYLNDKGQQLLADVHKQVAEGRFRSRFKTWCWVALPSGSWYSGSGVDPILQVVGFLNSHYNRCVAGRLEGTRYSGDEHTQTSTVLFYGSFKDTEVGAFQDTEVGSFRETDTQANKAQVARQQVDWIYTINGSLYALGKEKAGAQPLNMII